MISGNHTVENLATWFLKSFVGCLFLTEKKWVMKVTTDLSSIQGFFFFQLNLCLSPDFDSDGMNNCSGKAPDPPVSVSDLTASLKLKFTSTLK